MVQVRALPWPVVEMLAQGLRKLRHDLTNNLVANVSLIDLAMMHWQDPDMTSELQHLREVALRPRSTLANVVAPLPGPHGDRPQTLAAARQQISAHCAEMQVRLDWRAQPCVALEEHDLAHILLILTDNALQAHAAEMTEDAPRRDRTLDVTSGPSEAARVQDNASGCKNLQAAATGEARRAGGGHIGLGLGIAAALAQRAGLELLIDSPRSGGFVACLRRPGRG